MDLFGTPPLSAKPFRDIGNTRPSVAEEKAVLCMRLGELCKRCPASVANGSINLTRSWIAAQKQGVKIAANTRSSIHQLQSAISSMEVFL